MDHSEKTYNSLIYIDDLTQLYNRRYLNEKCVELDKLTQQNKPLAVVLMDVDHFKEINDTYGHLKGDQVLTDFSQFLQATVRATDIIVRYGGDEFVCLMPDTHKTDATQVTERILKKIKKRTFAELSLTLSAGIAASPEDGQNFTTLFKVADDNLYAAKWNGRDQIGQQNREKITIPTHTLINRREERERIRTLLTAAEKDLQVGIITGNVGIGKTRIVREELNRIKSREVLWCDCIAFENVPYYPIRELINYKIARRGPEIIHSLPAAYRLELGKLIPEIQKEWQPEVVAEIGLTLDKYRLYESIKCIFEIGKTPKIVVIDNMQWSDPESIDALKYLIRTLHDKQFTFMFIFRKEEQTDCIKEFITHISRENYVREIELSQLSQKDVELMLKHILGKAASKELTTYINQVSGGNPFFIEEIIKELSQQRYLQHDTQGWIFHEPSEDVIPRSIEDITARKYSSLSKEGREVIECVSALGSFKLDIIQAVTGYKEGHLIGILEKMVKIGLAKERTDKLDFQNEITRSCIYSRVFGLKRRTLHRKIVHHFEQENRSSTPEELAFHYHRAEDSINGPDCCLKAAHSAKLHYAHTKAIEYYSWAIDLLYNSSRLDQQHMKVECFGERALLWHNLGHNETAEKDIGEALQLLQDYPSEPLKVGVLLKQATLTFAQANYQEVLEILGDALEIAYQLQDSTKIATILTRMGNTYFRQTRYTQAIEHYQDALSNAKKADDKQQEAGILNNIASVHKSGCHYEEALDLYQQSLTIMQELQNKPGIALTLTNIGIINKSLGDNERAYQLLNETLLLTREIGNISLEIIILLTLSYIHADRAELKEAKGKCEHSLELARGIGDMHCLSLVLINLGSICHNLGDFQYSLTHLHESLEINQAAGYREGEAASLNLLGQCELYIGKNDKAFRYLHKALTIVQDTKSRESVLNILLSLSEAYLKTGKLSEAGKYLEKARHLAEETGSALFRIHANLLECEYWLEIQDWSEFKRLEAMVEKELLISKHLIIAGIFSLLKARYYTARQVFQTAVDYYDKALSFFQERGMKFYAAMVYYYSGLMYSSWYRLEENDVSFSLGNEALQNAADSFLVITAHSWATRAQAALVDLEKFKEGHEKV